MRLTRKDFLELAAATGVLYAANPAKLMAEMTYEDLLSFKDEGDATILFTTDIHGHMEPLYFMEPLNMVAPAPLRGTPGYHTGEEQLEISKLTPGTLEAYFASSKDFENLAHKFGKMGGCAHMTSVINAIRNQRGKDRTIVLDNGDTWATSAITLYTEGKSMVDWMNHTGFDYMVGHWDFTLGKETFLKRVKELNAKFISQNVADSTFGELIFEPYAIHEAGGIKIGILGNSFPYTPIANPSDLTEGWTFGIQMDSMQKYVNELREKHKCQVIILQSHDGLPLDVALAKKVSGIDIIVSGHTHEALPKAVRVNKTWIVVAGSHGKYVGRVDITSKFGRLWDFDYKLIPVASNLVPADPSTKKLVDDVMAPYRSKLDAEIGTTETLLYKRDSFYSTFDELVGMAVNEKYKGVDIVFTPAYRWGTTILPGDKITVNDVMDYTAVTYPDLYLFTMKGAQLLEILEDVADNAFNADPLYQQGGDMSRTYGMQYAIKVNEKMGKRISDITVNGQAFDPNKTYTLASWGGNLYRAGEVVPGHTPVPIYDVVIDYIKKTKTVKLEGRSNVKVLDAAYSGGPGDQAK